MSVKRYFSHIYSIWKRRSFIYYIILTSMYRPSNWMCCVLPSNSVRLTEHKNTQHYCIQLGIIFSLQRIKKQAQPHWLDSNEALFSHSTWWFLLVRTMCVLIGACPRWLMATFFNYNQMQYILRCSVRQCTWTTYFFSRTN